MTALIEGLTILEKYFDMKDGFHTAAEHDIIYVYETDHAVSAKDLSRLIQLGWFQDDTDFHDDANGDGDFHECHYNPNENWAFWT